MSHVQERYSPILMDVDAEVILQTATSVAGFLAKTAGTITVENSQGEVVIDAIPVIAGFYTPLPFYLNGPTGTVTLSGGASGTLGVW